jgi:CO/xanthine dehydrogenase FAD-binding subunit
MMSVSIKRIEILDIKLEGSEQSLVLNKGVTLQEVYESSICPEILRRTLHRPLSWQKRNSITVEQAVLSPSLATQWIAALLVLGTRVGCPGDQDEELLLADYLRRAGSRRKKWDHLCLPIEVPHRRWGTAQVARTESDKPVVSAIAAIDFNRNIVTRARLALTGVWRESVRLAQSTHVLLDKVLTEQRIHLMINDLEDEINTQDRARQPTKYMIAMATTMSTRALRECIEENSRP